MMCFRVLVFSQGNKSGLVGHNNPLGLSLGSKSPNLQSPPNVSVSKDLMGGMHQQLIPNTSHPNQLHSSMPMSSIQGEYKLILLELTSLKSSETQTLFSGFLLD